MPTPRPRPQRSARYVPDRSGSSPCSFRSPHKNDTGGRVAFGRQSPLHPQCVPPGVSGRRVARPAVRPSNLRRTDIWCSRCFEAKGPQSKTGTPERLAPNANPREASGTERPDAPSTVLISTARFLLSRALPGPCTDHAPAKQPQRCERPPPTEDASHRRERSRYSSHPAKAPPSTRVLTL